MDESYETFEEELWPPRPDPPPQKPVRQTRRPEMYATRRLREEMAPFPQQPRAEPKISSREPSYPQTSPSAPLHKDLSGSNLTQIETPWENVTLNRCLFVAITILVLTSGFQRLHETLRGQRAAAAEEVEDVGLTVKPSGALRHRGHPPEPEMTLWEVMFWWLPDLDDEEDDEEDDEDDDDEQVKRVKSKTGAKARASGLRNKPLPDKKLLKQREGGIKNRRAKKARDEEIRRDKKEQPDEEEEAAADEEDGDVGNEGAEPEKNNKPEEKKEKKKTQKG